jgi:MFS family permease
MATSDAERVQAQPGATPTSGRSALAGRLALVVVCLAVFLSALDQTVVVTALLPIIRDIGAPITRPDRAAWIVSGYLLGYVIALPLMGRVADVYGRRLVFIVSLAFFALGSLFCALAPALGSAIAPDPTTLDGAILSPLYTLANWLLAQLARLGLDISLPALNLLIGARFVQAIGGGALVPVAMAVAGDLFGPTRRGLALGLIGGIAEAGGVLGPLWGAAITTRWGWQWIFYINVPIAAALIVAGWVALRGGRRSHGRIDLLGALLFGACLVCLALGFGPQTGSIDVFQPQSAITPNLWLLAASGVFLLLFIGLESVLRSPLIEIRVFRNRAFASAAALSFFVGVALIVAMVLIPLFISTLQTSPDTFAGGLALLRMTALIPVGAFVGGWLANRFGCPLPAALGSVLTAIGLVLMSHWPANVSPEQITVATVIAGCGFGLSIAPISTSALNAAKVGQEGMAASVVTVLRMTGMIVGLASLTLWALTRLQTLLAAANIAQNGAAAALGVLRQVYGELFLVAAAIALVSVMPALLLWRKPRARVAGVEEKAIQSYAAL